MTLAPTVSHFESGGLVSTAALSGGGGHTKPVHFHIGGKTFKAMQGRRG
jgi:hypothetical protein